MGNLIQSIPVYKPQPVIKQQTAVQNNVQPPVENKYPLTQKYETIPARSLAPANTTPQGVKPQAPKGYLVKENIFQSAASTVKSYGKYTKYFYDAAFKGEGTDYSVGKINDLSIRTGSLGIAAVLASSKLFPFAKGMELVGLGTWFASMMIWPKLLGMPIKAKTGVDINQKYIDSYGRRKNLYEDRQYMPLELFKYTDLNGKTLTPEEYHKKYKEEYVLLHHIGDKLGVPRNIENRLEAIQEKVGQTSVQANTLVMLTAGVMTPVVSSIAADAAQTPIKNYLEKTRYTKQAKELHNLNNLVDDLLKNNQTSLSEVIDKLKITIPADIQKEFNKIKFTTVQTTDQYGNKVSKDILSEAEHKKLIKFFEENYFGTGIHDSIAKELDAGINANESVTQITDQFKADLKKLSEDVVKETIDLLKSKGLEVPKELADFKGLQPHEIDAAINEARPFEGFVWDVNRVQVKRNMVQKIRFDLNQSGRIDEDYVDHISDLLSKKAKDYIDGQTNFIASKEKIEKLFKYAETNNQLKEKIRAFEKVSIENISESITANNWAKVPKKYLKALDFTKEEIAQLAMIDSRAGSRIVSKKLEEVAKDPTKLEHAMKEMSRFAQEAISKEEKAVLELVGTMDRPGILSKLSTLMENVGIKEDMNAIKDPITKYYKNKSKHVESKLRNTIDSFTRPMKALDIMNNMEEIVKGILGHSSEEFNKIMRESSNTFYMFYTLSYEEAKNELKKYIKDAICDKNDINSWTTKHEVTMESTNRSLSDSLGMIKNMAKALFGEFHESTAKFLDKDFLKKLNLNNQVMQSRFLTIKNKLTAGYTTENHPTWDLVEKFFNNPFEKSNSEALYTLLDLRKNELSRTEIDDCKKTIEGFINAVRNGTNYDIMPAKDMLADKLNFGSHCKFIAEMSGKNITEYLKEAAQNVRSRNKWTKTVYGMLGGTLALSALVIATIGKENYFNKNKYVIKGLSEGVNNDNK